MEERYQGISVRTGLPFFFLFLIVRFGLVYVYSILPEFFSFEINPETQKLLHEFGIAHLWV